MEVVRTLKKVGGSVLLPILPETLREVYLQAEQSVRAWSEAGRFYVEPTTKCLRRKPWSSWLGSPRSTMLLLGTWLSTRLFCEFWHTGDPILSYRRHPAR